MSPSRQVSPSLMRAVTARRKLATGLPFGVKLESGSSVRLPVMVTWVSAMAALLGARGGAGWSVAVVVRSGGWSLPPLRGSGGGQQGAGGAVGRPMACWSAPTVLASCLLVGRCSSPAPGDRSLRAAWTTAGSRAAVGGPAGTRGTERASTAAPLTRAAARWQPVQQATGRSARGRRVPARGAAGEAGPCPRPPRWASRQLPAGLVPRRARSSPASSWQGPSGHPRPAGRRGQPPGALPPAPDPLAHPADGPPGQGHGRGDPDRGRLLDRWQRDGVVGQRQRGGRLGRLRRPRRAVGARAGGCIWPAWITHASPGWA